MGWTVWGSNSGGGEIFRTLQTGPGAHLAYRVIPELKRPACGVDRPPSSSAEVKERV
jgi:hypothetical protein